MLLSPPRFGYKWLFDDDEGYDSPPGGGYDGGGYDEPLNNLDIKYD